MKELKKSNRVPAYPIKNQGTFAPKVIYLRVLTRIFTNQNLYVYESNVKTRAG